MLFYLSTIRLDFHEPGYDTDMYILRVHDLIQFSTLQWRKHYLSPKYHFFYYYLCTMIKLKALFTITEKYCKLGPSTLY